GRVVGHIYRYVAHQLDAALAARGPERPELGKEEPLFAAEMLDGFRRRVLNGPVGPGDAAVGLLERHEAGVALEPPALLGGEVVVGLIGDQRRRGPAEQSLLVGDDAGEVDAIGWELAGGTVDVDQQRVARERRETLVGGVSVSCRAEREHLPDLEAGL